MRVVGVLRMRGIEDSIEKQKDGIMKRLSVISTLLLMILGVAGMALAEPKIVGKDVDYSAQGA
jgi:hypothetical protein